MFDLKVEGLEREPAPEQRLHSFTYGPCPVIQQQLFLATMVEPLHRGQHEIALLLWASRHEPPPGRRVLRLEGIPPAARRPLLGHQHLDPGLLRLRNAGLAAEQNTLSTPDERDELKDIDSSVRADLDLLFQLVNLRSLSRTMKPLR